MCFRHAREHMHGERESAANPLIRTICDANLSRSARKHGMVLPAVLLARRIIPERPTT